MIIHLPSIREKMSSFFLDKTSVFSIWWYWTKWSSQVAGKSFVGYTSATNKQKKINGFFFYFIVLLLFCSCLSFMTQVCTVKFDFHGKLYLYIHTFSDIYQTCCIDGKLSKGLTSESYLWKDDVVSEYVQTSEIVFIQALLDFYLKSISTYIYLIVRNFHNMRGALLVLKTFLPPL